MGQDPLVDHGYPTLQYVWINLGRPKAGHSGIPAEKETDPHLIVYPPMDDEQFEGGSEIKFVSDF